MAHEDFCGHAGKLNPGDLQVWENGQRSVGDILILQGYFYLSSFEFVIILQFRKTKQNTTFFFFLLC